MKQITQSPAEVPYTLVNYGVDTLVLNVRYADATGKPKKDKDALLPDHLIECLNAWQAVAREQEQPVAMAGFTFASATLMMYPHGAGKGQWRWLIACPSFTLTVSRGRLNGVIAQVRFAAPYLWSHEWGDHRQDIWAAIMMVKNFLLALFRSESGRLHLQVSEVHLCADLTGWDVSACEWQHTFVSRSRTRTDRPDESTNVAGGAGVAVYRGRRLATLNFGSHGSPLSCCIYNKSLEIKTSLKLWFQDIWRFHGWNGSSEVWRIEYRWKREALHEIKQAGVFHGVEDIYDLDPLLLSYLWTYATGHTQYGADGWPDGWLRYTSPSIDGTLSRWPVHPAWQVVQSAFTTETEPAVNIHTGEVLDLAASSLEVLIRERHYEVNVKRLSQQVGGCASTLAAWLGGSVDDLPKVLSWLVDHLPGYALPDLAKVAPMELLQAEYALQFADTIAEKQAVYGLSHPTNEQKEVQL